MHTGGLLQRPVPLPDARQAKRVHAPAGRGAARPLGGDKARARHRQHSGDTSRPRDQEADRRHREGGHHDRRRRDARDDVLAHHHRGGLHTAGQAEERDRAAGPHVLLLHHVQGRGEDVVRQGLGHQRGDGHREAHLPALEGAHQVAARADGPVSIVRMILPGKATRDEIVIGYRHHQSLLLQLRM